MNIATTPQVPLLDLDLLKTLVAIAETGNFSAAAEVVFRSPSAISMQIKKMEALLGRPVFIRDSRSVTLTEDGEALLLHARRVLALNTQIISQFIRPDVAGTVRLPSSALGGKVVEISASYGLPALPDYAIGMIITSDASAPIKAVADHLRATVASH